MRYFKPLSLYQKLLKLDASTQGRVLGLSLGADSYWTKCVGVAVSNPLRDLVKPYCVFDQTENDISRIASKLQDVITTLSVSSLVVGYPKHTQDILEVKQFVDGLSKTGNLNEVPYTFWEEEDLYAKHIRNIENPFSFDPVAAKRLSDKKYAASGVLEDYLENMKNAVKKDVAELS